MLREALDAALPELRREAEATFADTFIAYAPTTSKVNGLDTDTFAEQYQTPGKIQGRAREGTTQVRTVRVGGADRRVLEGGLHIPYTKPLPAEGWEFECIAVGRPENAFRIGRRWHVVEVPLDDATARRLDVAEVPQEAS